MELQDVVRHTHQGPFAPYFVSPPQQELPEALPVLDLSEHRLDDRLASGIAARHLRGHAALIEKNQPLRRDPSDGLPEGLSPLLIGFRVAFAGVE